MLMIAVITPTNMHASSKLWEIANWTSFLVQLTLPFVCTILRAVMVPKNVHTGKMNKIVLTVTTLNTCAITEGAYHFSGRAMDLMIVVIIVTKMPIVPV